MGKKTLIILVLIAITKFSFSQTDSITYIKTFNGYQFFHQDQQLTFFQLSKIIKSCPKAKKEMNKADWLWVGAYSLSYTGGYIVGYILGTALYSSSIDYDYLAAGSVLILASIPLNSFVTKHTLSAVNIYNKNLDYTSYYNQ